MRKVNKSAGHHATTYLTLCVASYRAWGGRQFLRGDDDMVASDFSGFAPAYHGKLRTLDVDGKHCSLRVISWLFPETSREVTRVEDVSFV